MRRPGATPVVRVAGFLDSEKGVGEAARSSVRALRAAGVQVVEEPLRDSGSVGTGRTAGALAGEAAGQARWRPDGPVVDLLHLNASHTHLAPPPGPHTVARVGAWVWELPRLPGRWRDRFDGLDEVWTPSAFSADAIAELSPVPVVRVPHALDPALRLRPVTPRPPGPFTFLVAFDHDSVLDRKNPLGAVEAFRRAFSPGDPVRLVVKALHGDHDPRGRQAVREAVDGRPGIVLLEEPLDRAGMLALLDACDCLVSLHRSEGFGLLPAEAMALGKPVVATGWSGTTDFLRPGTGFLVDHDLVPLGRRLGDYEADQVWAEPDLDHAARLLQQVVDDDGERRRRAARGRDQVWAELAPEVVGRRMAQRLDVLAGRPRQAARGPAPVRPDPLPRLVPASRHRPRVDIVVPVHGRSDLTRRCLREVLADLPPGARVVVVDDASPDDTPALLDGLRGRVEVVTHRVNTGFSTACNDGAATGDADLVVFLNNDTVPRRGWLDALLAHAQAHPQADVVGARLVYPTGAIQHAGVVICADGFPRHVYRGFPQDHPAVLRSRRFQVVTGACMLVRRPAFEALGGFDTAYRNGYEDVDLCLRVGARGGEVHYCADGLLVHEECATRGREAGEDANRAVYLQRWGGVVVPDETAYYQADGLLRVDQAGFYPLQVGVDPLLGRGPVTAPPRPAPVAGRTTAPPRVVPRRPPPPDVAAAGVAR